MIHSNSTIVIFKFLIRIQSYADLFRQVIVMSGNAECAWAVAETERVVDVCKKFAGKVGWRKVGEG